MLIVCNAVITIAIRLRYDYDPTTIRLRRIARACFHSTRAKNEHVNFCRSRIAVESNADRNFDHFRRNRMRRGIVVSQSNRNCDIGLSDELDVLHIPGPPGNPDNPVAPIPPGPPCSPVAPGNPNGPGSPGTPVAPKPVGPGAPVAPWIPIKPVAPYGPMGPDGPGKPSGPGAPGVP